MTRFAHLGLEALEPVHYNLADHMQDMCLDTLGLGMGSDHSLGMLSDTDLDSAALYQSEEMEVLGLPYVRNWQTEDGRVCVDEATSKKAQPCKEVQPALIHSPQAQSGPQGPCDALHAPLL